MGTNFQLIDGVVLVVYFLAMASIGPLFAKRNKSTENYFVGGRAYGGWLIGLSMFATSISSITFMAYPGDSYRTAWLRFLPCLMLPFGIYIASHIFLPFYRRAKITSAFEYLEGRFGSGVRAYAASAFIVGQIIRLSLILYLVSLLVYQITGLDPYLCVLVGGVVTSFYTITGGIEAVIWTDFIQSFLLWGGGFVCLALIIYKVPGGVSQIIEVASSNGKFMFGDPDPATKQLVPAEWFGIGKKTIIMMLLLGLNGWLNEYSSNQNVIQKYVATKNVKEATRAIWICCLCSVPTWAFFMFLGTSLYVFFQVVEPNDGVARDILLGANGRKADEILPYFVIKYLPAGMSGLVIAGVLAAAMSSLSSSINAISAVGIVDIYKRHWAKDRNEAHYMHAARMLSLAASVIMLVGAAVLMWAQSTTLNDTSTKLGSLVGGGLLGLYTIGFVTKRGDGRAVAVGIGATLLFTAYISALELKWLTKESFLALGLSDGASGFLAFPMDTYYAGLFGNLIMFFVSYLAASLFLTHKRDLTNLTIWTRDSAPLE